MRKTPEQTTRVDTPTRIAQSEADARVAELKKNGPADLQKVLTDRDADPISLGHFKHEAPFGD